MAFLTTAVPSILYTTQLLVTLTYVKAESCNSLNIIISVMDEERCIVCSESFENYLDLPIQ